MCPWEPNLVLGSSLSLSASWPHEVSNIALPGPPAAMMLSASPQAHSNGASQT
jgi:hypothetical protein